MKWCSAAALAILTVVAPAWAENVPPEPQSEKPAVAKAPQPEKTDPPTQLRWYGWQTLMADGASASLIAAGLSSETSVAFFGLGTYVFSAPIIHGAHDKGWQGVASLGLRVTLPLVGGVAGGAAADCGAGGGMFCGLGETVIGGMVGMIGAAIIDSAALAYDRVPAAPAGDRAGKPTWTPTVAVDQKRIGVGVQGTF